MWRFLIVLVVAAPGVAAAEPCPRVPMDEVCRPWTAMLLPSAFVTAYAPRDAMGPWLGGGVEVVGFAWSDPSPAFGPSHGKLRFDIGLLRASEDGAGSMVMYRGGAQVAFERNASRRWLIPYATANLGGLWTEATRGRGFVDGGAGVYLVHRRGLIVDLEATYLLPFAEPDELSGFRTQLAVSVALW